jgi:replication factor C large subunit
MTGGVQAAKAASRHGYVAFRPPSLWRRTGQTKKARSIRDSAAKKIGRHCHVSAAFARAELMGFVGLLLADKKKAAPLAAALALEPEEIALLLGSTPTTKKVQSIYEEAMKLRAAEVFEEIELSWQGSAQHSLGHAPASRVQAEGTLERTVQALEKPAGAQPPRADIAASAVGQRPEEPEAKGEPGLEGSAAKPEARKRGRPKKAESEGKAEKRAEPKQAAGKRQKSLFDF